MGKRAAERNRLHFAGTSATRAEKAGLAPAVSRVSEKLNLISQCFSAQTLARITKQKPTPPAQETVKNSFFITVMASSFVTALAQSSMNATISKIDARLRPPDLEKLSSNGYNTYKTGASSSRSLISIRPKIIHSVTRGKTDKLDAFLKWQTVITG